MISYSHYESNKPEVGCLPLVLVPYGKLGRTLDAWVLLRPSWTPLPQTILWLIGNTSVGDSDMKFSVRQILLTFVSMNERFVPGAPVTMSLTPLPI